MESLSERLVDKSIEAFITGLELYNKPTIRYRIEGFSFFAINSWELMLKAHLINSKGLTSIYFADNPDRTIDVTKAIKLIYTNDKDPLRINLEKIIELRNTSTHFITEDYETVYAPLFQAAVINYCQELLKFHNKDITSYIAQNFLTLSISLEELTDDQIRGKYSPEMAERFIKMRNDVEVTSEKNSVRFAIPIEQRLYITKKPEEADFLVAVDRNSETKLTIAKELRDPSNTHKYSYRNIVKTVNEQIKSSHINFSVSQRNKDDRHYFTTNDLQLFIKFYNVKEQQEYAYAHIIGDSSPQYSYSLKLIDFILTEIKKNPEKVIENLKNVK